MHEWKSNQSQNLCSNLAHKSHLSKQVQTLLHSKQILPKAHTHTHTRARFPPFLWSLPTHLFFFSASFWMFFLSRHAWMACLRLRSRFLYSVSHLQWLTISSLLK